VVCVGVTLLTIDLFKSRRRHVMDRVVLLLSYLTDCF
jgi:hypothetical protein